MPLDATLNSLCEESFMDNLSSISMENVGSISPTMLMMQTQSTAASLQRMNISYEGQELRGSKPSYLDTSNMVVTDMSSVLSQYAEENKYLGL